MKTNKSILKTKYALLLAITSFLLSLNSCKQESYYQNLRDFVDNIPIINTHEHQRFPARTEGQDFNFYHILNTSYLNADLVSAGSPFFDMEMINRGDLDELWATYGEYLDFTRNTSYYSHLLEGFKILYGFEDPYFTEENIRELSEKIKLNYSKEEEWYKEAYNKAGYEIMLVDQYWNPRNTKLDDRYFALVFNINDLVMAAGSRPHPTTSADKLLGIYKYASDNGFIINNLEDYLKLAEHLFEVFIENNALTLKNTLAYSRSLDFEYVSFQRANELYDLNSSGFDQSERKELQDFMLHWIIKKSIEVDLPMQIHTGYLAGNNNTLDNGQPIKLNNLFRQYPDARFVLFHGGFPWTGEFNALGKVFPNVYLDLVWLPQLSRESAILAFDQMLDCVPFNKISWGGDCHSIEESTGSLEFGKDVVATVLAKRIERGLMTEELAREIAQAIFHDNAVRFFKLGARD